MADEQNETPANEEAAPKGKGSRLLIIGGAVALLVVGLAVGGFMSGMFSSEEAAGAGEETPEAAVDDGPALYVGLHPPLTVNFGGEVGQRHFMQVSLEFMAREQRIVDAFKEHDAVIRNNLLLLLGGYDYETATTRAGKERMLDDVLAEVQGILSDRIGEPGVREAYFTTLVVQ
ncbi:flagellar basal body-associated FliL family protein [Lentisalinibacter orientalis]|uniref:flagellar basal body-associated FliL family protein n=1 Tax=Lentisalinibacter orientalis TaxID=2992241 RepID=UPI0038657CAC